MEQKPLVDQSLRILEVLRTHSQTALHDFCGRVTGSMQGSLHDNTQHSKQSLMPAAEFEPTIPARERKQTISQEEAWDLRSVGGRWKQER